MRCSRSPDGLARYSCRDCMPELCPECPYLRLIATGFEPRTPKRRSKLRATPRERHGMSKTVEHRIWPQDDPAMHEPAHG